jgi:hypothetical protein
LKIFTEEMDQPVLIAPLGDIQFTGTSPHLKSGCSVGGLRRHLAWLKRTASQLGAKLSVIGVGDYVDLLSPSNREKYRAAGLYSNARRLVGYSMSHIVEELGEIMKEHLDPEDLVVLLRGHHYFLYDGDDGLSEYRDSDEQLSDILGISSLPYNGAAYVQYKWPTTQYNVLASHGQGNGASLGYGLNKLDKMAGGFENVQAFAMGHTHKLGSVKKAKLSVRDDVVVHNDVRLITTGAFLRGWMKDELQYPEEGQMPPLPIGGGALYVEEDENEPQGHSSFVLLR